MHYLALLTLPFFVIWGLLEISSRGAWWVVNWVRSIRERRRQAVEQELDRTQAQLRATILQLASELSANGLEARKAMIRASYEAAQRDDVPPSR